MDEPAVLGILLHGNQLKRTVRSGWVQRGISDAESVAAHSYGVVFVTMVLGKVIAEPIDHSKALMMAALHDLPEGLTTDIPSTAWKLFPAGIKGDMERDAMAAILDSSPLGSDLAALWEEYRVGATAEARLVHDADKLEMYLQAVIYEEQTGNRQLGEFWQQSHTFHYPLAQAVYDALCRRRQELNA